MNNSTAVSQLLAEDKQARAVTLKRNLENSKENTMELVSLWENRRKRKIRRSRTSSRLSLSENKKKHSIVKLEKCKNLKLKFLKIKSKKHTKTLL